MNDLKEGKLILEESYEVQAEILTESNGKKKYVIKGLFSTPEERNRNGRIYPKPLWENALKDWKERAAKNPKYTLCELEHPPYAEPDPWKAVAKIRKLEFGEDGKIYGEAEILDNDADPRIGQLKALIEAGIPIGVSSRGLGRLGKGNVVEEYKLQTYDIVSNPSNIGSELQGFTESLISEKDFILNENGEYVCKDGVCKLATNNKEKTDKYSSIIEALKEYIEETDNDQLSQAEIIALQLLEKSKKKKDKDKNKDKEVECSKKEIESGECEKKILGRK